MNLKESVLNFFYCVLIIGQLISANLMETDWKSTLQTINEYNWSVQAHRNIQANKNHGQVIKPTVAVAAQTPKSLPDSKIG